MDKELIEHIKSQLKAHEENYSAGAWERFAEKDQKRRTFVYWPLWTAAAIILVFFGIFFGLNNLTKTDIAKSKEKIERKKPIEHLPETSGELANGGDLKSLKSKENSKDKSSSMPQNYSSDALLIDHLHAKPQLKNGLIAQSEEKLNNEFVNVQLSNLQNTNKQIVISKQNQPSAKKLTFEELLSADSKTKIAKTEEKKTANSKWESGVYVAPAMGNDNKVNVNYGFSLSYAVANKLSLNSGISYASLSSTETLSESSPQSLTGRNLGAVSAKVSGINVPLELRYNISDKFYTGVGVSALAVLNNSQDNTYLSNDVQTFASPSSAVTGNAKQYIVKEKTVEPQAAASVGLDNYIGFYNFSFGYKQKVFKKNNVSIEPFLQLPMKTFSKENLNLTNGGIRLKFDF